MLSNYGHLHTIFYQVFYTKYPQWMLFPNLLWINTHNLLIPIIYENLHNNESHRVQKTRNPLRMAPMRCRINLHCRWLLQLWLKHLTENFSGDDHSSSQMIQTKLRRFFIYCSHSTTIILKWNLNLKCTVISNDSIRSHQYQQK